MKLLIPPTFIAPVMTAVIARLAYATPGEQLFRWCRGIVAYNVIVERFHIDRGPGYSQTPSGSNA
jgi:hypothetical protein